MNALDTLLPTGGVGACLAAVIFYLLASNRTDRKEYQEAIDREQDRADSAGARAVVAELGLDEARAARRLAEDAAAHINREVVADLRVQIRDLERQVATLRHTVVAKSGTILERPGPQ